MLPLPQSFGAPSSGLSLNERVLPKFSLALAIALIDSLSQQHWDSGSL